MNNWDYFDKIYCISLDERLDRQNEAKAQFESVGLAEKIEFFIVKKHPTNPEQGIYESHINCIKKAIEENAKKIFIFEDDIIFEKFNKNKLNDCIKFLSFNPEWGAIFFGCLVKKSLKTNNKSILKIKYRSLTHAYAVNHKFAEILAKTSWQNIPYDRVLDIMQNDSYYAIYPSFSFQSLSHSDNDKYTWLIKIRTFLGGLKNIQKMNEFYHKNKPLIILIHIIVIILLCYYFLFF